MNELIEFKLNSMNKNIVVTSWFLDILISGQTI